MNPNLDEDIEESLDRSNKRLAIVCIIWCLITAPLILLFPESDLIKFLWLIWILVGVRLSPWIAGKIWKNYE